MRYKKFSKKELTEMLTNGIPMPKSALTDENTIDFYFEELNSFINAADNEYESSATDYLEITIFIDDLQYDFFSLEPKKATIAIDKLNKLHIPFIRYEGNWKHTYDSVINLAKNLI